MLSLVLICVTDARAWGGWAAAAKSKPLMCRSCGVKGSVNQDGAGMQ